VNADYVRYRSLEVVKQSGRQHGDYYMMPIKWKEPRANGFAC
jgi:hypothetical protein